jgi:hypothetical protein
MSSTSAICSATVFTGLHRARRRMFSVLSFSSKPKADFLFLSAMISDGAEFATDQFDYRRDCIFVDPL